jgi:hypothetical protein
MPRHAPRVTHRRPLGNGCIPDFRTEARLAVRIRRTTDNFRFARHPLPGRTGGKGGGTAALQL